MYCSNCGAEIPEDGEFCSKCGTSVNGGGFNQSYKNPQYVIPMKSAGIAAVLSFIFTGLGQIYLGKIGRGLLLICGGIVIATCSMVAVFSGFVIDGAGEIIDYQGMSAAWILIISIIAIAYWVWQIYDAYKLANEYNEYLKQNGREPW